MRQMGKTLLTLICLVVFTAPPLFAQTAEELNRQGVELAEKKRFEEALEIFRKATAQQDKHSAKAFHNRGWVLELQGNIPGALENYREAVRRDPELADSYERIGYWQYRAGKYADAVAMGEKVLHIDPANEDVKKWIYDAYKKRTEKPGQITDPSLLDKPSPTTVIVEPKPAKETPVAETKPDEKKYEAKVFGSLDFTIPIGYYYDDKKVKYVKKGRTKGNIPYTAQFYMKPIPGSSTRFAMTAGKPYLGAGMPDVIAQYERAEAVFNVGPFGVGCGLLISHYYSDFNFGKKASLTDVKLGAILEYESKDTVLSLVAYPKYIPLFHDDKHSTGKTFDACTIELKCRYIVDDVLSYFSRITFGDYYFYDNDVPYSNYWGYYDVAVGLTLGNRGAILGKDLFVTVELGKRVYLRSINNQHPYLTGNGSGLFGYDRKKTGDDRFSGYYGTCNIFSLAGSETINDRVYIYQKLSVEFVDRHIDHHEFAITLGAGGKY
jgi:tetratricopeptide (TPR) repeat protein